MNHGSFNIIFITPLQFTKTLDMQTLASSQIVVLKGQYHAIFSKTLKIEKTLFG